MQPNIILITTDQQRWDTLRVNNPDSPIRTSTLDSLAARGVNFTRAYSTCPVCIPARRSLLTGLHPDTHGLQEYRDGLEWDPPFTLPGLLSHAGYQTQLVGKLHLHPQRKRYGFDHMVRTDGPNDRWDTPLQPVNDWADALKARGITHPNNTGIQGNSRTARPWDLEERFHLTSWLTDQAVDFVTKFRDPACPYFLHLSHWAPHPPLLPPQAYWDRYHRHHKQRPVLGEWVPSFASVPPGIPGDRATGPFSAEEMHEAAAGYFGLIDHLDDRINFFLTRLFEYGSPRCKEPTYVIFTSDHGEMLGDHQLWRKSLPYEGSSHIPFLIAGFNVDMPTGTCDALVGLEDVCATALEWAGVSLPSELAGELESKSLTPCLRDSTHSVRDAILGECDGQFANHFVIAGPWKYVWFARTNEEQLFNLELDPCETNDLSGSTTEIQPLRDKLASYLRNRTDRHYRPEEVVACANRPPRAIWKCMS